MFYLPDVRGCMFHSSPTFIFSLTLYLQPCQALFVAPCSHVWHYKCIRPVINNPKMYPQFLCPNCRAVADLDADIEENVDGWDEIDELTGNEGLAGAESVDRRVATPVNGHRTGDDSGSVIMEITTPPQISINRSSNSGVSAEELQDTSAILFAETSRIELRDPRTVADSLEGVVTPRNEAGPFVFD